MPDADAAMIVVADRRVKMAFDIVARQHRVMAAIAFPGQPLDGQADLLRLFRANLAIFEQHAALLREPQPVPAPPQR